MTKHKELTFGFTSLNDNGHGFRFNITFHPTMLGKCDFDVTYIFDHEETSDTVGILLTHDDLQRLRSFITQAIDVSYNREPEDHEDEDDDYYFDLDLGDDD